MRIKTEVMEEETHKKYIHFSNGWFKLKWNSEAMEEFGKKVQSTLDRRKNWEIMLNNEIQKRMKYIPQKTFIEISEIPYNETLEEFRAEFNKKVKLRLIPAQKTISESTEAPKKKRGRPKKE